MNLIKESTLIGKFANYILVYSPFFIKMRDFKDRLFQPILSFCVQFNIKPSFVSGLGLLFGLISLPALFLNYWLFVALMSISLCFDFIDGSLARYTREVSTFGKYLDFMIDHVLMILMVFSLCHYIGNYYWVVGAAFFSLALYINVVKYTPRHIPSGRICLFIPCFFGFPTLGLLLLTLYGIILAIFLSTNTHQLSLR